MRAPTAKHRRLSTHRLCPLRLRVSCGSGHQTGIMCAMDTERIREALADALDRSPAPDPPLLPALGGRYVGRWRIGGVRRAVPLIEQALPDHPGGDRRGAPGRPGPRAGRGEPGRRTRRAGSPTSNSSNRSPRLPARLPMPPRAQPPLRCWRRCARLRPPTRWPLWPWWPPTRYRPPTSQPRRQRVCASTTAWTRRAREFWDVHSVQEVAHADWSIEALAVAGGRPFAVRAAAHARGRRLVGLPQRARGPRARRSFR